MELTRNERGGPVSQRPKMDEKEQKNSAGATKKDNCARVRMIKGENRRRG